MEHNYNTGEVMVDETSCDSTASNFSELQLRDCLGEALAKISRADLEERIRIMLAKETEYLCDPNYIANNQKDGMTELWRRRVTEWLLEFQEEFYISQDTVAVAVNYMDRYLSKESTKKSIMQLLAMGAVFVASKLHEQYPITMKELQGLAEEMYLPSDIKLMELDLLRVLQWNLNPITPQLIMQHLVHYVPCANQRQTLREHAEAFLDVALCEYHFLRFPSSVQGAAALLCAFDSTQYSPIAWRDEVNHYEFLHSQQVRECKSLLVQMFEENCQPLRHDSTSPVGVDQFPERSGMEMNHDYTPFTSDDMEMQFQTDEDVQWCENGEQGSMDHHDVFTVKPMHNAPKTLSDGYILPIHQGVVIKGGSIVSDYTTANRGSIKPVPRYPDTNQVFHHANRS